MKDRQLTFVLQLADSGTVVGTDMNASIWNVSQMKELLREQGITST